MLMMSPVREDRRRPDAVRRGHFEVEIKLAQDAADRKPRVALDRTKGMRPHSAVAGGDRQSFLIKPLAGFLGSVPGSAKHFEQSKMVRFEFEAVDRRSPPVGGRLR
jgi:hypothetical protein